MRFKPIFAAFFMLCGACTKVQDTTSSALDTVGNETSASWNELRDIMDVPSKSKKPPPKDIPQQRYCYHTYEDIICYSKPLPGEEFRMVGYQEPSGKTGYTMNLRNLPSNFGPPKAEPPVPQTSPPAAATPADPDKKQLKEVIFDPAELEPKTLVPDKPQ